MIKPPERVEIPEEEQPRERFARFLAIAIVLSTVGLALIEFAHGYDAKSGDHAGIEAQALGIQAQGASARTTALTHLQIDIFTQAEVERTRAGNAVQDLLTQSTASSNSDSTGPLNEQSRWNALAKLTEDFTPIHEDSPTGPDKDIAFPGVALANAERESTRLSALQDAANEERQAWEARLSQYAVILTLFAVAIYLFGLSLTLQTGVRRIITGLAVVLVVSGTLWGAGMQISRPGQAAPAVADDYANARLGFLTAHTHEDLQKVDALYSKVIDERPTYSQAYVDRSSVRFEMGSPEFPYSNITSLTTGDALRSSTQDIQKAYDLGLRTFFVLNNLAANDLLLGIQNNDLSLVRRAQDLTQQGIAIDSSQPLLYSNLAGARLLLGDTAGARHAFDDEIDRTLYSGEDHHRRVDPGQSYTNEQLSGTLTGLELIGSKRSDLKQAVDEARNQLVGGLLGKGAGRDLSVQKLAVEVHPSDLRWTASIPGFDPNQDTLVTQWYRNDPGKMGWAAINQVSGIKSKNIQPDADVGADGYFGYDLFINATTTCTAPGSYRVDVYVNGKLSTSASSANQNGDLQASFLRGAGVAICRPKDWTHDNEDFIRGLDDAYMSPDKHHGVVVYRIQNPDVRLGTDDKSRATLYRDALLGENNVVSIVPTQLADSRSDPSPPQAFLPSEKGTTVAYMVSSTSLQKVLVGSGVAFDGSVVVGLVFGPPGDFDRGGNAAALFDAMVLTG